MVDDDIIDKSLLSMFECDLLGYGTSRFSNVSDHIKSLNLKDEYMAALTNGVVKEFDPYYFNSNGNKVLEELKSRHADNQLDGMVKPHPEITSFLNDERIIQVCEDNKKVSGVCTFDHSAFELKVSDDKTVADIRVKNQNIKRRK